MRANERRARVSQEGEITGTAFLPDDGFIDIHEVLTSYMRQAKRRGVEFRFGVEVAGILREGVNVGESRRAFG
jgi:glycine/D-amino acid oxidase-like deaminating enzyme